MDRTPELRARERAFTLIEVVTSVTILAICGALLAPVFLASLESDAVEETRAEMSLLADALVAYYGDTATFPAETKDLWENVPAVPGWMGPYVSYSFNDPLLRDVLTGAGDTDYDAWATRYVLVATGTYSRKIRSYGPDKTSGGGDDIDRTVDVNALLRERTRGELLTINRAIYLYNLDSLHEAALAPPWSDVLDVLQTEGYLPWVSDYDKDGWGRSYVVTGPPVHYATSAGPP